MRLGRNAQRATRGIGVSLLAFVTAIVACGGDDRPPLLGDDASRTARNAPPSFDGDRTPPPPTCDHGPEGGVCECLELRLSEDPPNLYFVLDRSGSMAEASKWTTTRTVLARIVTRLGPRARFGVSVFPDPRTDDCAPGVEVVPTTLGDVPTKAGDDALSSLADRILRATSVVPNGGTPTSATLRALLPRVRALPGRTFVVLATDGGPNCNGLSRCTASGCLLNIESFGSCRPDTPPNCCDADLGGAANCLDDAATEAAITALADAGIATYVVGFPGSAPYAAALDRFALAGGTAKDASPRYQQVERSDSAAFEAALAEVAARVTATCDLALENAPPDPARVNVYLDGVAVPKDPENGWAQDGKTITLLGATCRRVLSGGALGLRVVAGCPTLAPK